MPNDDSAQPIDPALTPAQRVDRSETPVSPRRRRWPRRLLIAGVAVVAVIAVLLALAPTLLSSSPVRRYAISFVNDQLTGSIDAADVSLGWSGPIALEGVRVTDTSGREVLNAPRVSSTSGVWGIVARGLDFGEVRVESPEASLYVNEANEISLVEALQPRKPSPDSDEELPEIRGRLQLSGGRIHAKRENGPAYDVTDVNATVELDTLDKVAADIALKLTGGEPLALKADVRNLLSEGRLRPELATGDLTIESGSPIQVGPITGFLSPENRVDGEVSLKVVASGAAEDLTADIDVNAVDLQTQGRASGSAAPVDVSFTGRAARQGTRFTASGDLGGDAGSVNLSGEYQLSDRPVSLPLERIASAVTGGEPVSLPDFTLNASGAIDLRRLGQALPELLNVKEGREITSGRLEIEEFAARGGDAPRVTSRLKVTDLTASDRGRALRVEPITLAVDATLARERGLQIASAELKSSFADVTASGAADDIKTTFRADLTRLQNEIGQIFDLSRYALAGQVAGTAALRQGAAEEMQAEFEVNATDLMIAKGAPANAAVDLGVAGQLQRRADGLSGNANFSGEAGSGEVDFTYRTGAKPTEASAERILSAVLTGENVALPDFTVNAKGSIDLVRLGNALPGILPVKPGQEITGGRLEVAGLSARGGAEPAASGSATLTGLSALSDGRTVQVQPVSLDWDAALVPGSGLQIARADLKSSFAEVSAKGAAANVQAAFSADLGRLQSELSQIIDFGGVSLAGNLQGNVDLKRAGAERADVNLTAEATGLRYASEDRVLEVQRAVVRQSGHLQLGERSVTRVEVGSMEADFDGQVAVKATGSYDLAAGGFSANAELTRGDLGYAAARLATLGVDALNGYSGAATGRATAERASGDQPILSNGTVAARNVGLNGAPLVQDEALVEWKNVKLAPDGSLSADAAEVRSSVATVQASGVRLSTAEPMQASADLKASADLEPTMRIVAAVARMEKPPEVSGRLGLNAKVSTGSDITFNGKGGIDELVVGAGEKAVREQRLDFDFDGRMETQSERISLSGAKLKSTPLTAEVSGNVEDPDGACVLALKGRYDASWKELSAILHELAPQTRGKVEVTGRSASEFEISGSLGSEEGAKFRKLETGGDVKWASASVYGLDMREAKLSPELSRGRLTIPKTTIPAAGQGRVNIAAAVDVTQPKPVLHLPGQLAVLENVELNPLLSSSLLGRINPVFDKVARIEGRINLQTRDIVLPLGDPQSKAGSGTGVLDLGKISLAPAGFLGELLELGGLLSGETQLVEVSKVDLVVREGRIFYENFRMLFPTGFDLIFRGSVGFDDTLDLVISIPLREGLIRRVGGNVGADLAGQKSNTRVEIPLGGTRQNPKLDFSKINLADLLKGIVPTSPEDVTKSLLDEVLKGGEKKAPEAQPREQGKEQPPREAQPRRRPRDRGDNDNSAPPPRPRRGTRRP